MEYTFQYPSHIQEISRIRNDLAFLEKEWTLPPSDSRQILLIIEELFSNIVRYAFDDILEHSVAVCLSLSEGEIMIDMIDDGIPFNPLEYDSAPSSDPATSDAGGMGLTLISAFANTISYSRNSGKNHLIITKRVKTK